MKLHYKKLGTGPAVILLHGYLSSSDYWRETAEILAHSHTVITLDLLGFGSSPKPSTSDYTVTEQVRSIHDTITHLGITQYSIIGHSMGAVIAAAYSNAYPSEVTQQLLYMPPIFTSQQQAEQEIKSTNVLYSAVLYSPLSRFLWPIIALGAGHSIARVPKTPYRHIAAGLKMSTHRSRTLSRKNIIEQTALLPILQQTKCPTHLFVGKKDRAIYSTNLQQHTHLAPSVSVHIINDGHHFPARNPTHYQTFLM